MTNPPYASSSAGDDGWGPATSVRVGEGRRTSTRTDARTAPEVGNGRARTTTRDDAWSPAGPLSGHDQRATRRAEREQERQAAAHARTRYDAEQLRAQQVPERGLRWWAALLLLLVIAVAGVLIDNIGSSQNRGGFNIGIVVASVIAILVVKRSHMFAIVIAPPIAYSLIAMVQLYSTSGGLHDKRAVFDAAANYLVYGFPAIAAATAAVLIVAGIRLIARK
ncbi:DUF6542 domain-containing protein [uncultured Jatrophihabitans sp.]|uniref:DUF6542 domain-containing protein n=1 Tax=uncultured Jatrophihabitans sp. TaxID=1610747 RepID=UPI0035CC9373